MGQITATQSDELETPLITDLIGAASASVRQFKTFEIDGLGPVRMRTLTAGEMMQLQKYEQEDALFVALCFAICNAEGLATHIPTTDTLEQMKDLPAKVYSQLTDALTGFCMSMESFEETEGN